MVSGGFVDLQEWNSYYCERNLVVASLGDRMGRLYKAVRGGFHRLPVILAVHDLVVASLDCRLYWQVRYT